MRPDVLAAVTRGRLYYGWAVVAVGFLGNVLSTGVGLYSFSLLFLPMGQELGWSRGMTAGVVALRTVAGAIVGVMLGPLADRKNGARIVLVAGGALGGAALLLVSSTRSLLDFYLYFGLLWGIAQTGAGDLITGSVIAKWFIRKRGWAMALSAAGYPIGGLLFTPMTQFLASELGWRNAWVAMGLLTWLLIIPMGLLFMQRRPEDMGLAPDGQGSTEKGAVALPKVQEQTFTLREALRTRALWLLLIVFNLTGFSLAAVLVHQTAYLTDRGFDPAFRAVALQVYAMGALVAKPLWGFLSFRFHVRYCLTVAFLMCAVAMAALLLAPHPATLLTYAILYGLGTGSIGVLQPLAWANYFGRAFIGTIRGVVYPLSLVASAAGAPLAGVLYDLSGSYSVAFTLFLSGWLLGALGIALATPPQPPGVQAQGGPA